MQIEEQGTGVPPELSMLGDPSDRAGGGGKRLNTDVSPLEQVGAHVLPHST